MNQDYINNRIISNSISKQFNPVMLLKREADAIKCDKIPITRKSFKEIQSNVNKLHHKAMSEKKRRKPRTTNNIIQS
jgi:hypothetical protein